MHILCLPFRVLLAVIDFFIRALCDCLTPGLERNVASGKRPEDVLLGQCHRRGIRRVSIAVTAVVSTLLLTLAASVVAFSVLRHAVRTGEEATRSWALDGLALWLPKGWLPGFAEEAYKELVRVAATDESEPVRHEAIELLQPHYPGADAVVEDLGQYLSAASPPGGRRKALEAMVATAEASQSRDYCFLAIAHALQRMEGTGVRSELVPVLAARISAEGLETLLGAQQEDAFRLGLDVLIACDDAKRVAAAEAVLSGDPEGSGHFLELVEALELIDTGPCQELADRIRLRHPSAGHSISSLQAYVSEHPDGPSAAVARRRMAALVRDDGPFLAARAEGTVEALMGFLRGYPGHVRSAEARQLAREFLGRDFRELVAEGRLEVEFTGNDIKEVEARLRRRAAEPLKVRIPVGTYLVARNATTQNMVVTEDVPLVLDGDEWMTVTVPVACANHAKSVPGKQDRFSAAVSTESRELAMLMPVLDEARVPYAVRQAAVWIVTDDVDYGMLAALVRRPSSWTTGGTRQIRDPDVARALQICAQAGIEVHVKAVWADREKILAGLEAGDLRDWLAARTGATASPSSPAARRE
jgi:hypothetical protein